MRKGKLKKKKKGNILGIFKTFIGGKAMVL